MSEYGVDSQHWRKGAQWLSFRRDHAEMVANDELVRTAFNEHCAGIFDDLELGIHRGCLSDVSPRRKIQCCLEIASEDSSSQSEHQQAICRP